MVSAEITPHEVEAFAIHKLQRGRALVSAEMTERMRVAARTLDFNGAALW